VKVQARRANKNPVEKDSADTYAESLYRFLFGQNSNPWCYKN
jgi:hypothetical protein